MAVTNLLLLLIGARHIFHGIQEVEDTCSMSHNLKFEIQRVEILCIPYPVTRLVNPFSQIFTVHGLSSILCYLLEHLVDTVLYFQTIYQMEWQSQHTSVCHSLKHSGNTFPRYKLC